MYSNKSELIKAIEYLQHIDFSDMNEDKEYAIERCFEIIGGILKEAVKKKHILETALIKAWIRARDKISHFYNGPNIEIVVDSIKTLKQLKIDISKIK